MAEIVTGPFDPASYEALEADCLKGPNLWLAKGEFTMAVDYGDSAFRFKTRVMNVAPEYDDADVISLDVISLDGHRAHEMKLDAEPETGAIMPSGLMWHPIVDASSSEPLRACLYSEETAKMLNEEGRIDRAVELFQELEETERQRAEQGLGMAASASMGLVPGFRASTVTIRNRQSGK